MKRTKEDIISAIATGAGVGRNQAKIALKSLVDYIGSEIASGNSVHITGFGKFFVRDRAKRSGINPKTGDRIQIPKVRVPAFLSGK